MARIVRSLEGSEDAYETRLLWVTDDDALYFITSSVDRMASETMAFPANSEGKQTDSFDLAWIREPNQHEEVAALVERYYAKGKRP